MKTVSVSEKALKEIKNTLKVNRFDDFLENTLETSADRLAGELESKATSAAKRLASTLGAVLSIAAVSGADFANVPFFGLSGASGDPRIFTQCLAVFMLIFTVAYVFNLLFDASRRKMDLESAKQVLSTEIDRVRKIRKAARLKNRERLPPDLTFVGPGGKVELADNQVRYRELRFTDNYLKTVYFPARIKTVMMISEPVFVVGLVIFAIYGMWPYWCAPPEVVSKSGFGFNFR